jgi:ribonuclease BN (tRNA processing enzyme)
MSAGIPVLSGRETFEMLGVSDNINSKQVIAGNGYKVGNFKIIVLNAFHDIPCLGFYISHPESGVTVFLTDTILNEYSLAGVNNLMIEVNYSDEALEESIYSGRTHPSMRPRLLNTHMALSTVVDILNVNDLKSLNNIVLLHLSEQNSDEDRFIREVRETTGKQVYVADKGMEIDFNKEPF